MRASVPPLFAPWFSGPPAPAYLLSGEGAGLAELLAELWMERFRAEGTAAELAHWSPADVERESMDAVFRTPSFFCRFRVFVLPDLGELKKGARDALLRYLAAPDPSVVLVLPCSDRAAARTFSAVSGRAPSPLAVPPHGNPEKDGPHCRRPCHSGWRQSLLRCGVTTASE